MDEHLNDLAFTAAKRRLEQARLLAGQTFGCEMERPEFILACAQLLAIEYNTLLVGETVADGTEKLRHFLRNEF